MCERILLIDHGKQMLYGSLNDIRTQFAGNTVEVNLEGEIDQINGVENITQHNGSYRLLLKEAVSPERILEDLVKKPDVTVERFERVRTSLDEIFVQVVGHQIDEEERA
jgi:ABC-2 type transport system ATP-binding protein